MSLARKFIGFWDISKDVAHIDSEWYSRQLRGDAEQINEATDYLIRSVVPKLPGHLVRGAIVGGAVGFTTSCFMDDNSAIEIGVLTGVFLDWTQYGVRAMAKIGRAYFDKDPNPR